MKRPIHVVGIGGTLSPTSNSLLALKRALHAAAASGATTELLSLRDLDLPIYDPEKNLEDYGANVQHFIQRSRLADAMIWSTAGYHGTLAGVTKNALDFFEFLSGGEHPYLRNKVVGLIATSSGEIAAVNSINAMTNVVHSLRGTAAPLFAPIPKADRIFEPDGNLTDSKVAARLEQLGKLVVELATKFRSVETEASH